MKKTLEYTQVESASISIERKKDMMKAIYKTLEELGATSKDTAKTTKEINSKLPKEPTIKNVEDGKKCKKAKLNTPSFVGSLAGVMAKFGVLSKVFIVEKKETKWYIVGNIKMLENIKAKDM